MKLLLSRQMWSKVNEAFGGSGTRRDAYSVYKVREASMRKEEKTFAFGLGGFGSSTLPRLGWRDYAELQKDK